MCTSAHLASRAVPLIGLADRNPELRHYQYSAFTKWPGGVYGSSNGLPFRVAPLKVSTASPSMAGSRPGALIAGAWATLMHMGVSGYEASCREIVGAAKRLDRLIRSDVPELKILGKPLVSVVAFTTTEASGIPIYVVGDLMSQRGWHRESSHSPGLSRTDVQVDAVNALQNPPALHIACTRPTAQPGVVEQLVQDLKEAIAEAKKGGGGKDGTMVTLYGDFSHPPPP